MVNGFVQAIFRPELGTCYSGAPFHSPRSTASTRQAPAAVTSQHRAPRPRPCSPCFLAVGVVCKDWCSGCAPARPASGTAPGQKNKSRCQGGRTALQAGSQSTALCERRRPHTAPNKHARTLPVTCRPALGLHRQTSLAERPGCRCPQPETMLASAEPHHGPVGGTDRSRPHAGCVLAAVVLTLFAVMGHDVMHRPGCRHIEVY